MMAESEQALDVAQVERLAVKVKGLIDVLERTRAELEAANREKAALRGQLDGLREELEGAGAARAAEVDRLLGERDQIRERVERMLGQIEAIGASLEDEEALAEA